MKPNIVAMIIFAVVLLILGLSGIGSLIGAAVLHNQDLGGIGVLLLGCGAVVGFIFLLCLEDLLKE